MSLLMEAKGRVLQDVFNIKVSFIRPRPATKFAMNHFKDKPITVIEIGTLRGDHAEQILKNLNVEKIYLIDPWESYEDYLSSEPNRNQDSLNKDFSICKKRLQKWEDEGKVIYIKKLSHEALKDVPNVDYIYVDGNHEYDYVLQDLKDYFPKVKKEGIIAGDDLGNPGVNKAISEFSFKNKLVFQSFGYDWWFIK